MRDKSLGFEWLETLQVRPRVGGLGLKFGHGRLLGLYVVLRLINLCLSPPNHCHLTGNSKFGKAQVRFRSHQFGLVDPGINGIQKIAPMDILIIPDRQRCDSSGDMLNNDVDGIGSDHGIVGSRVNAIQGPDK